jgi:hypothetical protein
MYCNVDLPVRTFPEMHCNVDLPVRTFPEMYCTLEACCTGCCLGLGGPW